MLLGHVRRFPQYAAVSARLGKVLVAAPQDIAEFIVRQGYAGEVLKAYLVKHPQEQFLYLAPPTCIDILEVRIFGQ